MITPDDHMFPGERLAPIGVLHTYQIFLMAAKTYELRCRTHALLRNRNRMPIRIVREMVK